MIAYCHGEFERTLVAVHLGRTGGNYLWTEVGDFGSNSIATVIEDSVVMFGAASGTALERSTGAQNVFFVDSVGNLNGGAPAAYNSQRKDFYVKLDYSVQGESKVMAFHYNSQDSIEPLWTRTTPFSQFGGTVAIARRAIFIPSAATNSRSLIPTMARPSRVCRFSSSMDVTPSSPVAWSGFTPTRKPMLTIRAPSSCSGSLMAVPGSITVLSRSGRSSPTQPRSTPAPRGGYRSIGVNHH